MFNNLFIYSYQEELIRINYFKTINIQFQFLISLLLTVMIIITTNILQIIIVFNYHLL
jgi:hypothetical protein